VWLIENVAPFIVLLGVLVFFHELGHFLVGKWMGVRVLTFSIGFGPAIPGLSFRRGETLYRVNWFPLGGYVQFFGQDPEEELSLEDRRGSFLHAPLWRRFLIVLAGPVFNLVLPLLVFFPMFLSTGDALPARLGHVVEGGAAHAAGLQDGDVIVAIDGDRIHDWWAMERTVSRAGGRPLQVTVERAGVAQPPVTIVPEDVVVRNIEQLGWEDRRGRIMVSLQGNAPDVAVVPGSPAAAAGLQTFDRVVGVGDRHMGPRGFRELDRWLRARDGATVTLFVQPPLPAETHHPLRLLRAATALRRISLPVQVMADGTVSGITSLELVVARVQPNSPAARTLGLLPGDRLTHLNGQPLSSWHTLTEEFRANPQQEHRLRVERGPLTRFLGELWANRVPVAALLMGPLWPMVLDEARHAVAVAAGGTLDRPFRLAALGGPEGAPHYLFGASHDMRFVAPEPIPLERPLYYAFRRSLDETVEAYKITLMTVAGLFRGRVPMRELGGPLLIADLASQSMKRGWQEFLTLLVWLSINLGILNLLPIPVLDGGHLLLFSVEAVKRKPLSVRARNVATAVGFAMVLFIMLTAIWNDIARYWSAVFS
jgi:regulator of sigma E protease